MRVAYLGPPGTFSEEALGRCELARGAERLPQATFADAYEAVLARGRGRGAAPHRELARGQRGCGPRPPRPPGLLIRRELKPPVEQHLLVAAGTKLSETGSEADRMSKKKVSEESRRQDTRVDGSS